MTKATRTHQVTFFSPGTFVAEETSFDISEWSPAEAMRVLKERGVTERYGAKPAYFVFTTVLSHPDIDDGEGGVLRVESKQVQASGRFYIKGRVRSYDEVFADNDKREETLRFNETLRFTMRANEIAYVCVTQNSFQHCGPFDLEDSTVDDEGKIVDRGGTPERISYREGFKKRMQEEVAEAMRAEGARQLRRGNRRAN